MNHVRLSEKENSVIILDQSILPNREEYIELSSPEEMYEAIEKLRVRGAPAIGIFAGYAMAALAEQNSNGKSEEFFGKMQTLGEYLKSSRPTAVNLSWAVDRVTDIAKVLTAEGKTPAEITDEMRKEAFLIHEEDKAMCKAIAEYGLSLVKDGDGILTHCNAGPLATSEYGTALGPILLGKERGMEFKVFADETRPLLQGARLTSYELNKAGVDVTLICDNMASMVMKKGWVQAVFVGCDRVAANGDTANKIGTSGVAVLARHYGIPFYVLGPSSSIDVGCATGEDIPIEERRPDEIREMFYEKPMAPEGVKCFNPSFDVTDNSLISGIVTEKGIFRPPYSFK
ncbi:MAG: S-methyl-5-thioribose-1-phosphate isomerase [Firmicutes bacterium]|nr:S-methyl-5-thioribose-1-phosphate isomerase [Bacillota bacterium]